jgi:hypothetical protein
MRDKIETPHLTVIAGNGTGSPARSPCLTVLDEQVPRAPYQLALPLVTPVRACVISVGLDDLSPAELERILRAYTPRVAVDVRLSPSFSTWGLTRRIFNDLLAAWRVEYQYWASLSNRFVGHYLDYRMTLDRYARYLEEHADLPRLHETIRDAGPVLLLGRLPGHEQSERGVLANALANLGPVEIITDPAGETPDGDNPRGQAGVRPSGVVDVR